MGITQIRKKDKDRGKEVEVPSFQDNKKLHHFSPVSVSGLFSAPTQGHAAQPTPWGGIARSSHRKCMLGC